MLVNIAEDIEYWFLTAFVSDLTDTLETSNCNKNLVFFILCFMFHDI